MTLFGWGWVRGLRRKTGVQDPEPSAISQPTPVNFDNAMSVSAFWACVRLLSETIAAMPIKCYTVDDETKRLNTDYELWRLLNYQPNRYQTRVEFFGNYDATAYDNRQRIH